MIRKNNNTSDTIKVSYKLDLHRENRVIFICFEYDRGMNSQIRSLVGVRWSKSKGAWYVLDTVQNRKKLGLEAKPVEPPAKINEVNQAAFKRFIENLQLKSYSSSTVRTYASEFTQLLLILKDNNVDELTTERIRGYFLYCINELKLTENTVHSRINAVKFYFEQVLGRERFFVDIPRPKKPFQLPNVLAISQVVALFAQLENLKHKTMLYLAYSAGLRISEVIGLRVKDIHSARMVINIKGAKGKKDRIVPLSQGVLELLRKYYVAYRPTDWLFEGQYGNVPYSTRSLQSVFHRAKDGAKIIQDVTFHSLRHSYATHLHERGTDIKIIQELLGHNDIKTTLRYTHVSNRTIENIRSPFDDLGLK